MRLNFIFIFLFLIAPNIFGQLNNTVFSDSIALDSTKNNQLNFQVKGLSFIKNNEYFSPIISGATHFGQQIHPKLNYQLNNKTVFQLGVFIQKNFGVNVNYQFTPTYSVKYQNKGLSLIFGNLEGNLQHQFIEPIYNFEHVFNRVIEEGIQLKYNHQKFKSDIWINWRKKENLITLTEQEQIEGGAVLAYFLVNKNKISFSILSQSSIFHKGGQFYNGSAPVFTSVNQSIGFKFKYNLPDNYFINQISTENHFVYFTSGLDSLPFNQGNGIYLNTQVSTKYGNFMLSYWEGNNYINLLGGDLYSSVSKISNYTETNRQLLFLRWMKDVKLSEQLTFTARIEPYYDFKNKLLEHNIGLYLNYNLNFKVK